MRINEFYSFTGGKCSFDLQMLFVAGEGEKNKDVYHLLMSEKLHNMHNNNLGVR